MTLWAVSNVLGVGIAVLLLAWTLLLYVPFRWRPVGLYLFIPKMAAGARTPFIAAAGLLLALVGALVGSWWLAVPAALAAAGAASAVVRLGLVRADLTGALGPDWVDRIPSQPRARMAGRWWRGRLPATPEPRLRQDVVFAMPASPTAPPGRSLSAPSSPGGTRRCPGPITWTPPPSPASPTPCTATCPIVLIGVAGAAFADGDRLSPALQRVLPEVVDRVARVVEEHARG